MSDSRARIWFALFVLVIFCVGLGGGIAIGRHMGPPAPGGPLGFLHGGGRRGGPFGAGPGFGMGRGGPQGLPPGLLDRMTEDLKLDDTQRAQVRKILDDRRDRLEQIHREAQEKFDKEASDLHNALRAVLRPDQQRQFDEWVRRHRP